MIGKGQIEKQNYKQVSLTLSLPEDIMEHIVTGIYLKAGHHHSPLTYLSSLPAYPSCHAFVGMNQLFLHERLPI